MIHLQWEPMVLYRFFDADGTLLYVGITNHPWRRFAQHAAEKPWWHEVDDIEFESFPGPRHVAEAEEAVAIWEEQPRYNKHSPIEARYYPNHGPRANETVELYNSMYELFEGISTLYEQEGVT